jgi:hypothetical protein
MVDCPEKVITAQTSGLQLTARVFLLAALKFRAPVAFRYRATYSRSCNAPAMIGGAVTARILRQSQPLFL